MGQSLHVGLGEEEVHGLALVDPLLASCGGQYEPAVVDGEGGLVLLLEVFGDGFDLAVEVLVASLAAVRNSLRLHRGR